MIGFADLVKMTCFSCLYLYPFTSTRSFAKKEEVSSLDDELSKQSNVSSNEETRGIRIAKYIALSGLASRRAAEELIQQVQLSIRFCDFELKETNAIVNIFIHKGKVTLDGKVVDSPTTRVLPGQRVFVAGQLVTFSYFLLLFCEIDTNH